MSPAACSVQSRSPPWEPVGSGVRPKPAWSGATRCQDAPNASMVSAHAPDPVVPGPEPCSSRTVGPAPRSRTWTGEPSTTTVRPVVNGRRVCSCRYGADGLGEELHHRPAELRHVGPPPAGDEVAVDDVR